MLSMCFLFRYKNVLVGYLLMFSLVLGYIPIINTLVGYLLMFSLVLGYRPIINTFVGYPSMLSMWFSVKISLSMYPAAPPVQLKYRPPLCNPPGPI